MFSIILQIYVSGDTMYGALSFSIRVEISSYPLEFLDFKDLIIFQLQKWMCNAISFWEKVGGNYLLNSLLGWDLLY